jgi:hypothetical protein
MSVDAVVKTSSPLHRIGAGNCGSVWANDNDADSQPAALVIKRQDGGIGRSLRHEDSMHRHIISTIETYRTHQAQTDASHLTYLHGVNVPCNIAFLDPSSPLWRELLKRFPADFTACNAMISERIMPLPLAVRQLLATSYSSSSDSTAAQRLLDDKNSEHCLVRPYLGRRTRTDRDGPRRPKSFFSLRNFPLNADQVEELGLPATDLARTMADALAFLYWVARVDANDVEFVLGRRRGPLDWAAESSDDSEAHAGPAPRIGGSMDFEHTRFGHYAMWVLDFDLCRPLDMTEEGMEQAAQAFCRNDPYFPRPGREESADRMLWEAFEARFLETSGMFIAEQMDKATSDNQDGAQISEQNSDGMLALTGLPEMLITNIVGICGDRAGK